MSQFTLGPRSTVRAIILRLVCFFVLALVCIESSLAQTYTPTLPDNTLMPDDPIGTTPKPTSTGTYESVSNTNGGLTFFLPVLTLPQRGGWNLSLGLYNNSPNWSTRSDSSTTIRNQYPGPALVDIGYTNSILFGAAGAPLNWNIPTLEATIEYAGQVNDEAGSQVYYVPVVCVTNWVFTDWSGNRHPFSNVTQCSAIQQPLEQVTDSSDGSWLRLNTTNYTSNITVITKDGTTYNFPGFTGPFAGCNVPSCYGTASTNGNPSQVYAEFFSSMVDSTGQNTVTLSNSNSLATLTDTIGRTVTFGSTGFPSITYKDSNGTSQTVSIAVTQQSAQNYNFNLTCSAGKTYPNLTVTESYGFLSWSEHPLTYAVTFPTVNGVSRVYTLQFDGVGNLLQASYPEGGYTKYDYQDYSFYRPAWNIQSCSHTEHQVAHKRECTISSGCSSSQELVTTYTPNPDGDVPFNDYMEIEDPVGDVTYVQNQNFATSPLAAPHETSRQIYSPGQFPSTALRTIQTTYTPYVYGVDVQIPSSVTTILNDISPSLSSVTNYQYQTIPGVFYCFSGCGSGTAYINDATEVDQYDYISSGTGTALKKTAQTWMNSSNGTLYTISGGHVLDRLATRTVTDPATNNQATLSYGYNSVGEVISKTVGGTSVASLTTNYQRDTYGNMTQMTDPKNKVTNYGYTDNWADSSCASLGASAYLTSITDALGHVSKFSYYTCTGLKASSQTPNDIAAGRAGTTFAYDALGRMTSATYPDTGKTTNTYVDSTPNSVTQSSSITSTLNRVKKIVLDGVGRTSQTQLTSDPDGVDSVDTAYDGAGRKYCTSNAYRSTSDSTYGITTTLYDGLNRTTQVQPPDYWTSTPSSSPTCLTVTPQTTAANPSNAVTTTYSGNTSIVTDEAGRKRKSQMDALGRLTYVWEDPNGLNYQTSYVYDALGNAKSVTQNGSRQRTFSYNAFSQLVSATNPESGTVSYSYDPDGNLMSKTAPLENQIGTATVTTALSYDALNRLTGKTYSDGTLPVAYFYDGQTPPASNTSGTGTVTINGSEQSGGFTYATGSIGVALSRYCAEGDCTTGTITITVGSYNAYVNYTQNLAASTVAADIEGALNNSSSPVTASISGTTVNLTSKVEGTAGNYSLSTSITGNNGVPASYVLTPSGMSGGTNGYDSGTVSVTVNGFTETVNYGSSSTGTTIASALVTAFNGNSSSPINASSSGNVLTLTAKAGGSTTNYSLSATDTYNTTHFSSPSFTPAAFGFSLTGGCNADSVTMTNGIYHRTGMCDASGAEAWTFDSMGRVLIDDRNTNGIIKTTTYVPNLDGSDASITYPATARVITYTAGGGGLPVSASDGTTTYASAAHYAPEGALASLTNNGAIYSTFIYNSRLQPCWNYATTGTALAWNTTQCNGTATAGSILDLKYNFDLGAGDNGNVYGTTNDRDSTRSQTFLYDSLNRIATAGTVNTSGTNCWGETYGIDAWANLYSLALPSSYSSSCAHETPFNYTMPSSNQLPSTSGFTYDAAGNLAATGNANYTYNAESQMTSATIGTTTVAYSYDGNGRRVQKSSGTIYWYGSGDDALDETNLSGAVTNEYIGFGGQRIARRDSSNNVYYYFADHLGTSREIVQTGQTSACYNADFYPYGGEIIYTNSCTTSQNYKFTGKERDTESGLDNFKARYMTSTFGRFLSADPKLATAHMLDPQTLNRYSYVRNNPLFYVDRDGKDLDKAKADAKAALSQVTVKVDVGVGVTPPPFEVGKVKLGPGEVRAEATAKVNVKFNAGKLSASGSVEGGVSAGIKNVGEVGVAGSIEKVRGSVNLDTGKTSGPEPATKEGVLGVKVGSSGANASQDSYSFGTEAGEGLIGGGEVSITKEGVKDLKDAVVEVYKSLKDPGPPPPPPPPPPPMPIGPGGQPEMPPPQTP